MAITLDKTYRQEGGLRWAYLTPPDDCAPKHVKRRRARDKGGV